MSAENRRAKRKALSYPARIDAGDGHPPRDCMLSDVSESGARVVLTNAAGIPDRITLLLGVQGAATRHCQVVWREGDELGLVFKKNPDPSQRPLLRSRVGR